MKEQFDLDDLFETKLDELSGEHPHPQALPTQPVVMLGDDRSFCDDLHSPVYVQRSTKTGGCLLPSVLVVIALAVGFGLGALVGSWRSAGGDAGDEPIKGAYVAIFYQDSNLDKYTPSQREFLNSVDTGIWIEEHDAKWIKFDAESVDEQSEIEKLPPPFDKMAAVHRSKDPWIVIGAGKGSAKDPEGKKFASEPIESNDQAMKLLQKWIK